MSRPSNVVRFPLHRGATLRTDPVHYRADNFRSVRPISDEHLKAILETPRSVEARERNVPAAPECFDLPMRSHEPIRQDGVGGHLGLAIMLMVACAIGWFLASGGVL